MVAILVLIFNSICLKSFSKQMFTSPPISMMRSIELTCQRQNTINCLLHPEGRDWPTKTLEDTRSVGLQWELVWTYFQRQINQQTNLLFKEFLPSASLLSWDHFSSKPPLQSSKKNYFQENMWCRRCACNAEDVGGNFFLQDVFFMSAQCIWIKVCCCHGKRLPMKFSAVSCGWSGWCNQLKS